MKVELHLHQPLEAQEESLFGVGNAPGSPAFVQSYTVKNLDTIAHKMKEPEVLFGPKETPWGDRILVVKDPDGHRLEFREERE